MHINFRNETIALDHGNGDHCFLSHAHSDHIKGMGRKQEIIASEETIELSGLAAKSKQIPELKLLNAGHILGAKQLQMEGDGESVVYTGDFNVRGSLVTKGAEIPRCDRLIMESTYADPKYKFPDYFDVCDSLSSWVNTNNDANIIIGAYELGKAQEVIKILNEYSSIAPIVTENIENHCKIYGKYGVDLKRIEVGTAEAEEVMKDRFVAILPMRKAKKYFARRLGDAFNKKTLVANVTGWALFHKFNVDNSFPLSDHSDFYDLKYYIEQTGAKKVEFFEGDGSKLISEIRKLPSLQLA
ncbi:MAG: hypothetical protein ABIJ34_04155 [archaeon]